MPKKSTALVAAAGALLAVGAAAAPSYAADGGRPFNVSLTGAAEVPGPGDPDGSGTAMLRLNPGQEKVCFDLMAEGIAPVASAHIHEGAAGTSGGVVVGLMDGECVDADRETILEILRNPENYYVNVHTGEFRAGAIRGQLG